MGNIRSLLIKTKAFDLVIIVFFILLSFVNLIFLERIPQWDRLIIMNIGVISLIFIITYLEEKYESTIIKIFHYWYIAPLVLLTFKELYFMIHPIRPQDYDWLFIKIDHWMFGTNPTQTLQKIAFPLLTEILQIIYGIFYLLPILLCLFLLRNKERIVFEYAVFSIIYGFYLSYIGYFALPGVGPRFTLHNFAAMNHDLPGLWLTNYLRDFVNIGESIPPGTLNPAAVVQRDVFPSGHTMITLLVMYLSVKLKSRSKYFFIPVGTLLIFSTVYLWYHYVIDLAGGLIFMIFSAWSGKYIFNWWQRKVGKEEFHYEDIKLKDRNKKPEYTQAGKKKQVRRIFESISGNYDFLNHLLSFGFDFYWRKKALKLTGMNSEGILLDVACGTGDVAAAARKSGVQNIFGADFSFNMLKLFGQKCGWIKGKNVQSVAEDMPLKDNSVTNITVAFGVRNFYDIQQGFDSFFRILKKNGKATIIEFRLPSNPVFRWLYKFYFKNILPVIGGIISGDWQAYKYLPNSVEEFDEKINIPALLKNSGFENIETHSLTFGIVQVVIATK